MRLSPYLSISVRHLVVDPHTVLSPCRGLACGGIATFWYHPPVTYCLFYVYHGERTYSRNLKIVYQCWILAKYLNPWCNNRAMDLNFHLKKNVVLRTSSGNSCVCKSAKYPLMFFGTSVDRSLTSSIGWKRHQWFTDEEKKKASRRGLRHRTYLTRASRQAAIAGEISQGSRLNVIFLSLK